MSWPYKVEVRESVREVVAVDDSIRSKLDLVPILPEGGMREITRTILGEHGFESGDDGKMVRSRDGVDVSVDPGTGEIEARAKDDAVVDVEDDGRSDGCTCRPRSEEAVREALRRRARHEAKGIADSLQREVTGRLLGSLADLGCEMEQIANQVTGRALKRRAEEIGRIRSIRHDERGGMTIVVEV